MLGLIAINKAKGPTSRFVTTKISHLCKVKQTGHAGTLDPLATGVLPVMVGRACKFIQYLQDKKEYIAVMQFGLKTDTGDITGSVLEENKLIPLKEDLETVCNNIKGEVMQTPPVYSALKKDGIPLYEYARKNVAVDVTPRKVRIDKVELLSMEENLATIKVACGGGTYIRTLCEDIAAKCGALATMTELNRTMDAGIPLEKCITLEQALEKGAQDFGKSLLIPPEEIFSHLQAAKLENSAVKYFSNGGAINKERVSVPLEDKLYRVYSGEGIFLGLGEGMKGKIKAVWINSEE